MVCGNNFGPWGEEMVLRKQIRDSIFHIWIVAGARGSEKTLPNFGEYKGDGENCTFRLGGF